MLQQKKKKVKFGKCLAVESKTKLYDSCYYWSLALGGEGEEKEGVLLTSEGASLSVSLCICLGILVFSVHVCVYLYVYVFSDWVPVCL